MRRTPLLATLVLLAGPAVRADTVEASSTTLLRVGQDTRYRGGAKPDLVTVAPAFEILSVTARDIQTGFADDVQAVLSTWGSLDLGERRWDSASGSSFAGDVTTGYLQARMLGRHLTLRVLVGSPLDFRHRDVKMNRPGIPASPHVSGKLGRGGWGRP